MGRKPGEEAPVKLGIVIPLWQREELTRLTLQRISREVEGDEDCVLVAITNEFENGVLALRHGFELVRAPNQPLSDKKNSGIQHLRGRVEGVVLLGSDDWATGMGGVSLLDRYREALSTFPFIGPLDMWYVDLGSSRGGHCEGYGEEDSRHGEPSGVGRAMRTDLLDAIDWRPRPPGLPRSHDGAMRKVIEAVGFACTGRTQEELGVRIVDIKSDTSVTEFSSLRLRPHFLGEILAPFPDEEVNELMALTRIV